MQPHIWVRRSVDDWETLDTEQSGSSQVEWLLDPDGRRWLYKPTVTQANGEEQGGDWAEDLAAQVARCMGAVC